MKHSRTSLQQLDLGKGAHAEAQLLHGLRVGMVDSFSFPQRSILVAGLDKALVSMPWPHGPDLPAACHLEAFLI